MGNGGEKGPLTGKSAAATGSGQAPALLQSTRIRTSPDSTKKGDDWHGQTVASSTTSTHKTGRTPWELGRIPAERLQPMCSSTVVRPLDDGQPAGVVLRTGLLTLDASAGIPDCLDALGSNHSCSACCSLKAASNRCPALAPIHSPVTQSSSRRCRLNLAHQQRGHLPPNQTLTDCCLLGTPT